MKKIDILPGHIFTRLQVIGLPILKNVGKNKRTFLECKCLCGTIKFYRKDYLLKGSSKSCGCLKKEQARQKGKNQKTQEGYIKSLFYGFKTNAKKRKLKVDISEKDYSLIVRKNCFYCGVEPKKRNIKNPTGIIIPTNGIDRIDSKKGYEIDNVVACCWICNEMKSNRTVEEFLNQVKKIMENSNG